MSANNPFPATSRYATVEVVETVLPDGSRRASLRRRFVPDPSRFVTFTQHTVALGDRIDRIAYQYLGDPLQFWRIADANGVLSTADLEQLERQLRITLPDGMPGVPSA